MILEGRCIPLAKIIFVLALIVKTKTTTYIDKKKKDKDNRLKHAIEKCEN